MRPSFTSILFFIIFLDLYDLVPDLRLVMMIATTLIEKLYNNIFLAYLITDPVGVL